MARDASEGLPVQTIGSAVWAWFGGAWSLVHEIKTGDWLWRADGNGLASRYYGSQARADIDRIKNFPPNVPILGPMGASAHPGDRILIPGLAYRPTNTPTGDEPSGPTYKRRPAILRVFFPTKSGSDEPSGEDPTRSPIVLPDYSDEPKKTRRGKKRPSASKDEPKTGDEPSARAAAGIGAIFGLVLTAVAIAVFGGKK